MGMITASFSGKTCSPAFVQLYLYFEDDYDGENGYLHKSRDAACRTFCVLANREYNVRQERVDADEEYSIRLEKIKAKCDVMHRHFNDESLFVAFQDSRSGAIFSYVCDMSKSVLYNSTFHFFTTVIHFAREAHARERDLDYTEISNELGDLSKADFLHCDSMSAETFFTNEIVNSDI